MQELIQKLMANGLTEEQAVMAANTTKDYIKSKVPGPFAGIVDNFLAGEFHPAEKITEFTHEAIDKSAEFAKDAGKTMNEWAGKAGDAAEDAMDKIKEMLGHKPEGKPGSTESQNKK